MMQLFPHNRKATDNGMNCDELKTKIGNNDFCAGYVTGLLDKTQADAMCAGDKAKAQEFAGAMCTASKSG